MTGRVLLYGATGFSGRALAAALADLGDDLILAGRDAAKLAPLAASLGLAARVFALDAPGRALLDIGAVLHCAGPFAATAAPMLAACMAARTDYFDLSGEWPVFAHAMGLDAAARRAGIMLLPGIGFTIAASDCLLAMAARTPGTVKLRLAVSRPPRMSRGSVATMMGLNDTHIRVRRGGQIVTLPAGQLSGNFDFGDTAPSALAVTWPDIVTGQFTTGIADIETFAQAGTGARAAIRLGAAVAPFTQGPQGRAWLRAAGGLWPEAPAESGPDRPGFVLVAEALDRWRRVTPVRIATADGYAVTTLTAATAIRRWRAGTRTAGFTTPASLFGADYIVECGAAHLLPPRSDHRPALQDRDAAGAPS